jgi:hypothetical protein
LGLGLGLGLGSLGWVRTRSCRSATRRRGLMQGRGSAQGRTRAVSASTTRATRLSAAGSVPWAAADSRARSISPPAIGAERDALAGGDGAGAGLDPGTHPGRLGEHNAPCPKPAVCPGSGAQQAQLVLTACDRHGTRRVGRTMRGGAGRCGTVVIGDRVWWRPSARGAQELRRLHECIVLRRHPRQCGTSLLGKTSDRRNAHRPWSAFLIATGPLRHSLVLGRHDAARGRSARAQRVLLGCSKGEINGEGRLRSRERSFPGHDAQAEHVRVFPQGPLGPPAPRGSRVEPRGARAGQNKAPRAAQAVPGGEALSTKMGDAHAEHAPEGLVDPAVAWGTLGAHVVTARGARRACGGGGVSVRSL